MLKSVGFTFGSKLLSAIINFAMIILLSQELGASGKGQCSLYLVIFSTALILCECISGSTVVYLLSKFSHRQLLEIFYLWSLPCSAVVGLGFLFAGKIGNDEWPWVAALCWLNAAVAMNQLIALGKKKLVVYNALNLLQPALSICAVWVCFRILPRSPMTWLIALVTAWAITAIVGWLIVSGFKDDKKPASWRLLVREGFRFGIANQAGTLMQLVNTRIGYMMLQPMELGIFSNAVSLCEATLLVNSSIGTIQYSKVVLESAAPKQVRLTTHCFWLSGMLMIMALSCLAIIPESFFTWLFGNQFEGVKSPILLILPGIFFYSGYIIFSYYFSGTGRFHFNNYPALAALLLTVLAYAGATAAGLEMNITLVSIIVVFSYAILFLVSLGLFLKSGHVSLREFLKPPSWHALKELL